MGLNRAVGFTVESFTGLVEEAEEVWTDDTRDEETSVL
jgi:hypothetical protein